MDAETSRAALELLAIARRWQEIHKAIPPDFAYKSFYRLVIHPDLLNEICDHCDKTFGRFDAGLANYIHGLKIVLDQDTEGWRILHVSEIPPVKLAES
jgi:hypothetical protein